MEATVNRSVRMIARGMDVTARDRADAERYLHEDAGQFRRDWNYDVDEVCDTCDEVSEDGGDARMEVEVDDSPGRGERTWHGRAVFEVVVPGMDDEDAVAAARALLAA